MDITPPSWLTQLRAPSNSDKGDPNVDKLFLSVGHALHNWEMLNQSLTILFTLASGAPHAGPAKAFSLISSVPQRLNMIKACLAQSQTAKRNPELGNSFKELSRRVTLLSSLRNHFAHSVAASMNGKIFEYADNPQSPGNYYLIQPFGQTKASMKEIPVKRWYASATVTEVALTMAEVQEQMERFTFHDFAGNQEVALPIKHSIEWKYPD